jgi:hypothetical protein
MITVQHWKVFASHYNDESSGIGLELKKNDWHTKIMRAWEYLYRGKYCLDQGNLMLMMYSHTYMKGELRRIINCLCWWKRQIAVSPFKNFSHPNTTKMMTQ